jgi:hypothetical protein
MVLDYFTESLLKGKPQYLFVLTSSDQQGILGEGESTYLIVLTCSDQQGNLDEGESSVYVVSLY